jgi:3-phenylpropionate/trans-cinnamate dioxygenase ferredoxin reductase subunit
MATDEQFVIVGAGLAGARAAEALRSEGFAGAVTLIGEENELPYERPPLSKGYLMGKSPREATYVHPAQWYADQEIALRLGVGVSGLDPAGHQLTLADGGRVDYAKLLLATGSSPRRLSVPGADLDGVLYLRRLADSDGIKGVLQTASRVVVIGGGWIGLEIAAAARIADVAVTVLEGAELPLLRVLGREVAATFAALHRRHGVDLRCSVQVAEITGQGGQANGVRLVDGTHIAADAVIVGVGIMPNIQLAEAAGLKIDNGVWVDERLRTSDDDIYAAGDVANAFHPTLGRNIRVEHWANAQHQPEVAARGMLGQDAEYDRMPYFFTDQYDLGMEYTGYVEPGGYDEVILRGDVAGSEFVAFWASHGRVLAGMSVNIWDLSDSIEALVRRGLPVDARKLADAGVPLGSLVRR